MTDSISTDTSAIKVVIDLVIALIAAGEKVTSNPSDIAGDIAALFPLIIKVKDVAEDLSQVPAEIKDLDHSEIDDLIAYIEKQMPSIVGSGKVFSLLNAMLGSIDGVYSIVKAVKG